MVPFVLVSMLGILVFIAVYLHRILALLQGLEGVFKRPIGVGQVDLGSGSSRLNLPSAHAPRPPVLAIWVWQGTHWVLDLHTVPTGYRAVAPPPFAGSFPGQRVKKECERC